MFAKEAAVNGLRKPYMQKYVPNAATVHQNGPNREFELDAETLTFDLDCSAMSVGLRYQMNLSRQLVIGWRKSTQTELISEDRPVGCQRC